SPAETAPLHAVNPPPAQPPAQPTPTNGAGAARAPYQAHPPAGAFHLPAQPVPRVHVDPEPTAPLPQRASPSSYPREGPVTPLPPFPEPIPAGVLEGAGQAMAPLPTPRPPPIAVGRGPLPSDTGVKKLMEAASTGEHPAQRPPPPHEHPREVEPP